MMGTDCAQITSFAREPVFHRRASRAVGACTRLRRRIGISIQIEWCCLVPLMLPCCSRAHRSAPRDPGRPLRPKVRGCVRYRLLAPGGAAVCGPVVAAAHPSRRIEASGSRRRCRGARARAEGRLAVHKVCATRRTIAVTRKRVTLGESAARGADAAAAILSERNGAGGPLRRCRAARACTKARLAVPEEAAMTRARDAARLPCRRATRRARDKSHT